MLKNKVTPKSCFRFMLAALLLPADPSFAQSHILLYEGGIPNSIPAKNEEESRPHAGVDSLTTRVSVPDLTFFRAPKGPAQGTAVIICPGGGYGMLLTKREGSDVARAFNEPGVTAFVLKYSQPVRTDSDGFCGGRCRTIF